MTRQSERKAERRQRTGNLRLGEQSATAAGVDVADLSQDFAHLSEKLRTKRATIRALEAKIKRLEDALRAGTSWDDYKRQETGRDRGQRNLGFGRKP